MHALPSMTPERLGGATVGGIVQEPFDALQIEQGTSCFSSTHVIISDSSFPFSLFDDCVCVPLQINFAA